MNFRAYNQDMPYLIDGHNLIPKLGISLSAEDDEKQLVERVQNFARITRKTKIEIFFDRRADTTQKLKIATSLKLHFIKPPKIADDAIIARLRSFKAAAKNWSVVSSDQYVQREAKALGAAVLSSEEFASIVRQAEERGPSEAKTDMNLSEQEVNEWLRIFKDGK